jgi:virulence-associated protein VapD
MNKELDNYLVEKYPKIFINRYSDMKETAMCWGFENNDGWFWLLDQLCESIQSHIDSNNKWKTEEEKIPQFVANQVKEKFGSLCFYGHGGDSYINGMIKLAENMSMNICEICGTTENVGVTSGWIQVICEYCHTNGEELISKRKWTKNKNYFLSSSKELRKIKIDKLNNNI